MHVYEFMYVFVYTCKTMTLCAYVCMLLLIMYRYTSLLFIFATWLAGAPKEPSCGVLLQSVL